MAEIPDNDEISNSFPTPGIPFIWERTKRQ